MTTACDWSAPGADAYTGTPRAAIMAMAELPRPVRLVLAERAERHDFDDAVLIDRDSIHGQHADYTDLRSMAFGASGKVCATVKRNWLASQVEGGWIYCEGAWCVLMPAPCRNWSIVTRIERGAAPAVLGDAAETDPAGPIGAGIGSPAVIAQTEPIADGQGAFAPGSWGSSAGFGYAVAYAVPTQPAPCPAVPEPGRWALIAAGVALMAWRVGR